MQTHVAACVLALMTQSCSLFHWNDDSRDIDAGDAGTQSDSSCTGARACFASPQVTGTSWGITSVSVRIHGVSMPTLVIAAHGSSELVELKPAGDGLQVVSRCQTDMAPWQAVLGDFDLDGKDDLAVASPGTAIQSGEVSFWRADSTSWSESSSQKLGSGTYAVAIRSGAKNGDVVAAGASYTAQTFRPFRANSGSLPTAGAPVALEIKPTVMLFGSGASASSQLYIIGNTSTQGRLLVYDTAGGSPSKIAESAAFGTSLNDLKLGDLNGDSILDAVIIDDSDSSAVYSLTGDASHKWSVTAQRALSANSHALTLDDFDRDGKIDVATISGSTNTVQLCFGDGHGAFGNCELLPHGVDQPTDVTSADLDADGWIDIVVVGYEGQVSILRGGPSLR